MRVSCSVPVDLSSATLVDRLTKLGIVPIQTSQVIRAVYEGSNRKLGEAIVEIFSHETDHDITVFYDQDEQRKSERRALRKAERAAWNARLHGH